MAEIDDRIRECFPHPTYRPGQLEAIREAIQALEGGAKNVIVEAPTGAGKTPMITTMARYFTWNYELAWRDAQKAMLSAANERDAQAQAQVILGPHQAHMITSLKMLQDQYLKDDKLVQIMKGKGTYMCHAGGMAMSCADHEAMFGQLCRRRQRPCEYMTARGTAQLARLTLHNVDSFLNQVSLGQSFRPRKILTIDEAHGVDDRLIKFLGFEMNEDILRRLDVTGPYKDPGDVDSVEGISAWLTGHDQALEARELEMGTEVTRLQEKTASFLTKEEEKSLAALSKRKGALGELRRKLKRYLLSVAKVPWAVERRDRSVTFEPVRSSFFAQAALLDYGERRVFMSATIFDDGKPIRMAMNLKKDETHYIAVPCVFPAKNRPLVATGVADTGQKNWSSSRPLVYEAMRQILARHPNEKGVVHCNSYMAAGDLTQALRSPRVMAHDSSTRDQVVDKFMTSPRKDAVLMGVFLREGYDFKDDIARFQIIVRLPFAYPDKRTKMREEIEPGYYDWLCAIDLVQTCGRGTRNDKDHCVTYCLDSRLLKFIKRTGEKIPTWFRDSIVGPDDIGLKFTDMPRAKSMVPDMDVME